MHSLVAGSVTSARCSRRCATPRKPDWVSQSIGELDDCARIGLGARRAALLAGLALLAFVACKDTSKLTCTPEWVYGLHVEVRDAATNHAAADGALIIARDGSYVDTLDVQSDALLALGAGERAGTYSLTIAKSGYQPWQSEGIQVTRDECHVTPVVIRADLLPE